MLTRTETLNNLGAQEQARWVRVKEFETVPSRVRIDNFWISKPKPTDVLDVVVELQPILNRLEVDELFRAIADLIGNSPTEQLITNGRDLSGRNWLRGNLTKKTIQKIAKDFYSVQSLHDPLYSVSAAKASRRISVRRKVKVNKDVAERLPCVAVFDDGVPAEHPFLASFRRGEFTSTQAGIRRPGTHGSKVASRVVFGELDFSGGLDGIENLDGDCGFLDVNVAGLGNTIHEKSVHDAMGGVVGAFRDVRVFNFSFSAISDPDPREVVKRKELLLTTQDVDNFVFENDVIVAVCAGNSPSGVVPNPNYPNHVDDANWIIGHWASGFNTLVTGSYVDRLTSESLANGIGWPSPFTKIGPGILGSPVPNFSAPGGNRGTDHRYRAGLGVTVCGDTGHWEDASGTSFAVPITARQAAIALDVLSEYCKGEDRPFGVTAKAFLALTSKPPSSNEFPDDVA